MNSYEWLEIKKKKLSICLFQNIFQPISKFKISRHVTIPRISNNHDLLPLQTQPVLSENLSVVLCFRRVSRGNAAWRSSQATKALLPPPLPVSATLLTVSWKRCSSFPLVWRNGERENFRRLKSGRSGIRLWRRVYTCNRESYGGAVTHDEHAKTTMPVHR